MCLKLSVSFAERTVTCDGIWSETASDLTIHMVNQVSTSPTSPSSSTVRPKEMSEEGRLTEENLHF